MERVPETRRTDPNEEDGDRRSVRRANALGAPFELAYGLGAISTGIYYVADPSALNASLIAKNLGSLSALWGSCYFLVGLLIVAGLLMPRIKIEIVALWLALPIAMTDGLALLFGGSQVSVKYALGYFFVVLASCMRLWVLLKVAGRMPLK